MVKPMNQFDDQLFLDYLDLIFLMIAAKHVPIYARLPIHASFALVALDKACSGYKLILNNISLQTVKRKKHCLRKGPNEQVLAMGHSIKMTTPVINIGSVATEESTTIIRLSNLPFSWKPGQHVRLFLPRLGAIDPHTTRE